MELRISRTLLGCILLIAPASVAQMPPTEPAREARPPIIDIHMHSLRIGDTVGKHEVHFGNLGETLVLRHTAHTRDTFASGALRAAAWLADKPAGRLYSMLDALGMS